MSKRDWLFLAAVLALAALLRLGWPGVTEFKLDEAHLYSLALDMAEFKAFPLRGIGSSVGLPNSPISVYLFALPLLIWKSPLAATLFVGLLNTVSVALAYGMVRRYWNGRAALIAALLYAAAPWAVIYSRKIWAQDLLPLFVTGWVFSALLAFVESRRKWLIAHLVLLGLIIQIHFSGIALLPVTVLLLIIFRKRVDWRMAGWGAVGAAVTVIPFGIYAVKQGGRWAGGQGSLLARPVQFSLDALKLSALVIQGTDIHSLAGAQAFRVFLATVPDFNPLLWLGGLLALCGLGYTGILNTQYRILHKQPETFSPKPEIGFIFALWLVLPILFFIPHLTPVYPHYFIILFPAPYLLAGIFLEAMLTRFQAVRHKVLLWLLPLALAGSQVWLSLALLNFIGTQNTPGGFGTPLGMLLDIGRKAQATGTDDVLIVSEGADPSGDSVPAVFDALLRGTPHRFIDARTTAVFPAQAATIVLWPGIAPGTRAYHAWDGANVFATVSLRAGEGETMIIVGSGEMPVVPNPREASALLGNGAEMLGSGGDSHLWQLWWRAPGPSEAQYQVFAHLLEANGERAAQVDLSTYANWHEGDLVTNYFALNGEGVAVRAGMYAYPSLEGVSVLDVNGNPAGEWIVFPISP